MKRPIYFRIGGIWGWYIWDYDLKDILEGENCGPFYTKYACWDAINENGLY